MHIYSSCVNTKPNTAKTRDLDEVTSEQDNYFESTKPIDEVKNEKIDSLKIGVTFYRYDAFESYDFIETEPYEFISVNSEMKSSQLMVFKKREKFYIILVTASDRVDKFDYDWEKLEKKIEDIIVYSSEFSLCWYVRSSTVNQDGSIDTEGFAIGKLIRELEEGTEYWTEKRFVVDYQNSKIHKINDDNRTFLCTDGY